MLTNNYEFKALVYAWKESAELQELFSSDIAYKDLYGSLESEDHGNLFKKNEYVVDFLQNSLGAHTFFDWKARGEKLCDDILADLDLLDNTQLNVLAKWVNSDEKAYKQLKALLEILQKVKKFTTLNSIKRINDAISKFYFQKSNKLSEKIESNELPEIIQFLDKLSEFSKLTDCHSPYVKVSQFSPIEQAPIDFSKANEGLTKMGSIFNHKFSDSQNQSKLKECNQSEIFENSDLALVPISAEQK